MKGRVVLTVFLVVFICLASTAFAEQVVEVVKYPWIGFDYVAAGAADGSVWVGSDDAGTVTRVAPGTGGDMQVVARVFDFPGLNSIAANSADGSVWVGDWYFEQVVHLAADGTELSRTSGIGHPNGLSVDPVDGSCWVSNRDCDEGWSIIHIAANGTELVRQHIYGSASGNIAAVPGTNSCWFSNCNTCQITHLQDNLDGTATVLSHTDSFSTSNLSISVDASNGTLWVAVCATGGQVLHLQEDPEDYSIDPISATPMAAVRDVSAVPGAGAWVMTECGGGTSGQRYLVHLDAEGDPDATVTDFACLCEISADGSDGSCWALEARRLGHVDVTGESLQQAPLVRVPRGVAADPNDGSSWVADCDSNWEIGQVLHIAADGTATSFTEAFVAPIAVAVNPVDSSVWVLDACGAGSGYPQVIHLASDGTELARSESLCCTAALAVDPNDGSCWLADPNEDLPFVARLSPEDCSKTFEANFCCPTAIAVDPADSSVWVGLSGNGFVPAGRLIALPEGDSIIHFEDVDDMPSVLSAVAVPDDVLGLAVDTLDSSCLAVIGSGSAPGLVARSGGVAPLDGPSGPGVPVLRVTETPSGPTTAMLGNFFSPRSVSVSPLDRSIWVGDAFEVGHMRADGTALSRTAGYCCVQSLSIDASTGSCWVAPERSASVVDLAVVPEANFTASATSGVAPFEVDFTDLSVGSITSWAWSFGDGGTSTELNPTHTYLGGHYTVALTVEGALGSDTETKDNYIFCGAIAPAANFSATPTTGRAPLTVEFEDTSTNNPTEWTWNFGDGGSSTEKNPTHVYEERGTYSVSLVVANVQGFDIETKADYIDVQQPLVAAFSTDLTRIRAGGSVRFTDESEGGATSWLWDFGDHTTSTAKSPTHTYNDPGFYTVMLRVGSEGLTASATQSDCIAVGFTDTPVDDWAFMQEIACAEAGIVEGYYDGSYDPTGEVNRAQMATFIARAVAGGEENVPTGPATPTFSDVEEDYWAYKYIEYCVDKDIVVGFWGGVYRPDLAVNRGQMAVYIARAVSVPTGMESYVPPTTATFSDVTRTNEWSWAYKYVEYVAALEPPVVVGYQDGTYRPQLTVTRDQMAVYMQRAFDLAIPGATD